jgi:hypothetical protein
VEDQRLRVGTGLDTVAMVNSIFSFKKYSFSFFLSLSLSRFKKRPRRRIRRGAGAGVEDQRLRVHGWERVCIRPRWSRW